jgi:hypothetical protein
MATAYGKEQCSRCNEENDLYDCKGCKNSFCFSHLTEHREEIQQDFHHIEHSYNLFQEKILTEKNDFNQHSLIETINQWEFNSIKKIKRTAEKCKEMLIDYMNKYTKDIEDKLKKLFEQLQQINKTNKYNEIDSNQLKQELNKLKEEFNKPANVKIEEKTSSQFINEIYINLSNIDQGKNFIIFAIFIFNRLIKNKTL